MMLIYIILLIYNGTINGISAFNPFCYLIISLFGLYETFSFLKSEGIKHFHVHKIKFKICLFIVTFCYNL